MKIKRFLLRYYPPGIFIEYMKSNGDMLTKSIDLVQLSFEYLFNFRTNVDELVEEIVMSEPIITEKQKP